MTIEEFLEWEDGQPLRHELIDGEIVAMTGARPGHIRMVRRLARRLEDHLLGVACEAFMNDLRVQVPRGDIYYPDIAIVCGDARPADDDAGIDEPTIIVEVLSPGTSERDLTLKRRDIFRSGALLLM
ncbi:MAG TPA: Uma2 family endonuclease [Geminicoccaceae bacterium]|nr:Uma2 family endonuclease [Geminicoccaceae bacterium]